MAPLFKKKEIFKVKSLPVDPASVTDPRTADDFRNRGVAYYARKQFSEAEADLKKAISMDGKNIDSYYSLGMVLKAMDRKEEAVNAFNQVITLILANPEAKSVKNDMLRRLALGHMNEITKGDWDLEKEIWKRT
ncbi:MAG: tetratricopeptide repeat protein [Anaerolineales bacterium]